MPKIYTEKQYKNYTWNMMCAQYWFKQIDKDTKAKARWQYHLEIAQVINKGTLL